MNCHCMCIVWHWEDNFWSCSMTWQWIQRENWFIDKGFNRTNRMAYEATRSHWAITLARKILNFVSKYMMLADHERLICHALMTQNHFWTSDTTTSSSCVIHFSIMKEFTYTMISILKNSCAVGKNVKGVFRTPQRTWTWIKDRKEWRQSFLFHVSIKGKH